MAVYILETQGQVVEMTDITARGKRPNCSRPRGRVVGFSKASRRRMINFISRLELKSIRCTFLTLTFHGKPSFSEAKRALKQFVMRLRRAHPAASGVWRAEMQARGSVHYHLIMFNLPYIPQANLQQNWTECTREDVSFVHVTLLKNTKMVMRYVAKYVAKVDKPRHTLLDKASYQHKGENQYEGRSWGWINLKEMPLGTVRFSIMVDDDEVAYMVWSSWCRAGRRYPPSWSHCTNYLASADTFHLQAFQRDAAVLFCTAVGANRTLSFRKRVYGRLREEIAAAS